MKLKEKTDALQSEAARVEITYDAALQSIQAFISQNYAETVADIENNKTAQEQLKSYIRQYMLANRLYVVGMPLDDVIAAVYAEMAEYSILTPLLSNPEIEEINVNAWNDIQIVTAERTYKFDKIFRSPTHASDVIRRMLQRNKCGTLDDTHSIAKGYLDDNIRLTVLSSAIVGDVAGVASSIRLVNPKQFTKSDFVANGTCSKEMYEFLIICFLYGISECFAGETGSGKTTIMADIMRSFPDEDRLITIENDVREFDLIKRDENGKIINNVLHLVAKQKQGIDEARQVSANDLLVSALTMHPQAICVAEMKDKSAWTAQEASHTGHTVLTTTHAGSTYDVYSRLATLCLQAFTNIPFDVLLRLNCEAFPIAVYQHKFRDGVRRITDISECIYENGTYRTNEIFRYETKATHYVDGKAVVEGCFVKCGTLSDTLKHKLLINGCPHDVLEKI